MNAPRNAVFALALALPALAIAHGPGGLGGMGGTGGMGGPGDRRGLIIRAAVISQQGAILAYLSEVDNQTNDASYQEAFRFGC
jgi:hypothetical protein